MSSSFVMAPALLMLLALAGGWVALFIGMLVVLRRRHRGPAVCAKCGYAVAGLDGLRCPECGSDLRDVGVLADGMHRGIPPLVAGVVWAVGYTAILPIPAFLSIALVRSLVPATYTASGTMTLGVAPRLNGPRSIDLTWSGTGQALVTYDSLQLVYTRSDGTVSAPFDVDPGDANAVSEEALHTWLAGPDGSGADPTVAARLLPIVTAAGPAGVAVRGTVFNSVSSGSSSSSSSSSWPDTVLPAAWGVIWVAGVTVILVRSVRRRR